MVIVPLDDASVERAAMSSPSMASKRMGDLLSFSRSSIRRTNVAPPRLSNACCREFT